MSIMLFVVAFVASFIIVRIGAVAFQLTGLEWSLAKFQALSCFSGTGFTTKESELITSNLQRRRIASFLMVLGNAGLVTMVASGVSALTPSEGSMWRWLFRSILPFGISPGLVPWINASLIGVLVYVMYRILTNKRNLVCLTNALRKRIIKRELFQSVSFDELLVVTGGYGVTQIQVRPSSPILDKSLIESGLRQRDITVLAITRGETTIPNPPADTKILLHDRLISFGKLENIRSIYGQT
jgi:K+/H+ antiporter YhaU regulatory subunit KhtT